MMDTFHYIKGDEEIVRHIRMCWASLWTARAAYNRFQKQIDHNLGLIAPIVQRMVHADVAGVLFTANPITGSRDELVIESNWGIGESVVSGKSLNDFFVLDKENLGVKQRKIAKKTVMVGLDTTKGHGRAEQECGPEQMERPTLRDEQLRELASKGLEIERWFDHHPQDIEWAYQSGELFILQSRNVRNLNAR
jgi:pyruvate,water dikinase